MAAFASLGLNTVFGLFKGHEIRAKDATNENDAANQAALSYEATMKQVETAINNGSATPDEVAQYIAQYDQYIEQYLQKQVGTPGTAWNQSLGTAGTCNKQCTVGCCIYYTHVQRTTQAIVQAMQVLKQQGGPVTVGTWYGWPAGKYGMPAHSNVPLLFNPSSIASASSLTGSLSGTVGGLGSSIENLLGIAQPAATLGGSPVIQSKTLLIVAVLAAGLAVGFYVRRKA